MRNLMQASVLMLLVACGGEEAPSCQQAIAHYYEAGCRLVELSTNRELPAGEAQSACQQLLVATPDRCVDPVDDLRICWAGVRSPASSNADCDCSQELEATITCE